MERHGQAARLKQCLEGNHKLAQEKEAHMSLTMAILMLVGMWLSVAAAMLWGVLRIVRRHSQHHPLPPQAQAKARPTQRAQQHAGVH